MIVLAASWPGDNGADLLLGQPNFAGSTANNGGITANGLSLPHGVAVDTSGRVYVMDLTNNRVLVFSNLSDTTADMVLGQPSFTIGTSNTGGVSAVSMSGGTDVAVDSWGRVYVADRSNNRVLVFSNLSDTSADTVLGQPNFAGSTANIGGLSANSMSFPHGLAVDSSGRLFVSDLFNHRVLVFNNLADTTADMVLGQPSLTLGVANNGGVSQNSLNTPNGLAIDNAGRLFVADPGNHRVLVFSNLSDTSADTVLGQPSFAGSTSNNGGISRYSFATPGSVTVDTAGVLFVSEQGNHRILVFNDLADTAADAVLGQASFSTGTADNGGISNSTLDNPTDVHATQGGRLYVADGTNNRILVFFTDVEVSLPVASTITPTDTRFPVKLTATTTESYVQINLPQSPVITAGVLKTASDSIGTGAIYTCSTTLLNAFDSTIISIWTNQGVGRLFLALRSDTISLDSNLLPTGIPNTATGRNAFGATIILTEFSDSNLRLIGDSRTTSSIGDSYAYTIRYFLSAQTVELYRSLGFNTSPGSGSFGFYYADTYGGGWTRDANVTVNVVATVAPHALEIRVSGITKDLPGGLGGVSSGSTPASDDGDCVIGMAFGGSRASSAFPYLRSFRDTMLDYTFGRLIVRTYYGAAFVVGLLALIAFASIFVQRAVITGPSSHRRI